MQNNTPLVSYIVPIYNAEKFLRKTLDALSAQEYENVEFILVDDGSTDASSVICDEYCNNDERFSCIHIPNGGVSNARNTGIEKSHGEYLMFSDADDIPDKNIIKVLVEKNKDDDIVLCGFKRVNGDSAVDEAFDGETVYTQKNDIIRHLIMPMCVWNYTPEGKAVRGLYGCVWRGLYKKTLFTENGIKFDKTLSLGEDMAVNTELFYHARSVRLIPDVLYEYIENTSSATHTNIDKLWKRYLLLWRKTGERLDSIIGEDDKRWYAFQLTRYAVSAVVEGICPGEGSFSEKRKAVKRLLSEPEMKKAVTVIPKGLSIKDKILLKMLRPIFASAVLAYYKNV